ncbi:hypothetical protein Ae201684P_021867 [Aphanomyces euteiches]|uniref:Sarcosine dehydrogenase, mitochondrial n=1 Tax=Aphanomyces euteiches TaxID=100861 RepID=A0A6G0WT67_9STRA|nr:hypothetical protein Ae201684_012039 [Aphanomyces euteiches]KAH9056130.1 hypothetical protein Ae201684P_021867 [Aphanomyces euteiches]KAH9133113.1 hypothetical protein AeRB84_020725 [Aphanomyces euteiches]
MHRFPLAKNKKTLHRGHWRSAAHTAKRSFASLPSSADVVVVGGGSIGASTLYHLSQQGVNAVLVEKDQMTAGTTWHSAGLLWRLRPSDIDIQLIRRTRDLAKSLEAETGISTGWVENGGLFIANNHERLSEYQRLATLGKYFDIPAQVLSPSDTKQLYPLMNVSDLHGTLYSPGDGTIDPSGWVSALTKGARQLGGQAFENTRVEAILTQGTGKGKQVTGVQVQGGHVIQTKKIVNCGGVWAPALTQMVGQDIPICAMHHAYVVSERIEGIQHMPNVRDHDASVYLKLQGDVLQIGGYEPNPIFWEKVDPNFAFSLFELDWDVFSVHIDGAVNRVPIIGQTGVRSTVCGPESFTPDHKALLGELPGVKGFYLGCGFNSAGIMLSGGCGEQIANWITKGGPTIDMFSYDVNRFYPSMLGNRRWNEERSHEAYAKNYSIVFPHDEPLAGRNIRLTPFHSLLKDANCVFQSRHGYERPGYFAPPTKDVSIKPYTYYGAYGHTKHAQDGYLDAITADNTFGWPVSHEHVAKEVAACRNHAAMFDQSYFGKFMLEGPDASKAIEWICTNEMKGVGKTVYTLMCNPRGGTECDLTVSQVGPNAFYIVAGGASATHDWEWIQANISHFDVTLQDFTDDYGVLSIQGPRSRAILQSLTSFDLSDDNLPFSSNALATVAGHEVRILRLTFVGELGYELHVPKHACADVYKAIQAADPKIVNAGYLCMDSMSVEKGYKHWHEDLRIDDTPVEAGMLFTCKLTKEAFIGKDVVATQKADGVSKKLICLTPDEHIPLKGNEAIWRNNECIGFIRRSAYGHTVGKSIGYGYVVHPHGHVITPAFLKEGQYEIETLNERRVPATFQAKAVFDPTNSRVKGHYDA